MSALLKMETYTDGGFRISFDAACQRAIFEDLLDHYARDFAGRFVEEHSSKLVMYVLKQYFHQRFSDELSSNYFFSCKEKIVCYLLCHLEESIELMGLLPWINGRIKFWGLLQRQTHINQNIDQEEMFSYLDGFLLPKDVDYMIDIGILSCTDGYKLNCDLFDVRTHPMGWSKKELLLSGCLFAPDTLLLNRLHVVRLRDKTYLRVWYLRDGKTGKYLKNKIAVELSDEELKDFTIGIITDLLPQVHFQTLGYCEWEHIVTVLLRTVLLEALENSSIPKDMLITYEKIRFTINQLVIGLITRVREWIELMILANGFLSSCWLTKKLIDLKTLANLVADSSVFHGEVEAASQSVLLLWYLRSESVSLYEASCARLRAKEMIHSGEWRRALKA